ncbi:MAG TPA: lysophospholipid acyltransferase family protein [Woeseiaceae bacterium]|nr:lysophospholipid acyltransferase family protein [Woeseiaceae bacterium]
MLLLRSLVFQVYFFVSVLLFACAVFLSWPFSFKVRFALARTWARSMLWVGRVVCGLDYVIEGEENIPNEPSVIMIKHSTVFEAYAQLAVFPPQTWVIKRELTWIPIFGWGLAAMRPIAIDRRAGHTAVSQVIAQGRARLRDGIWVTIFPEGTRVRRGTVRKYGVSGAALASNVGCPVVPVAHNAGDLWPRRSLIKRPGLIRFCIGPAIDSSGRSPREINESVRLWIETRMDEISA